MSLINDALKKAQRLRLEQQAAAAPAGENPSASGPIKKRGKPMRAQSLILICAGAAVLIVFSVLATFFLLTRDEPAPSSAKSTSVVKPAPLAENNAPPPVIVAPVIPHSAPRNEEPVPSSPPPGAVAPAATTTSAPVETKPAAVVQEPAPQPAPPATEPVQKTTPPNVAAETPSKEKIEAFLDTLRVSGVRSSGADSKVLMNDRVFRLNDVVDRSLGLKLIKVEADSLVFSDASGATYTKTF